jgi:hypothetical protein
MTWVVAILGVVVVAALAVFVVRWRHPDLAPRRITPSARRILFPFIGDTISHSSLDAVLRLARAEQATLVPAYIATVPLHLELEAPIQATCEQAMPLLEAIEQRAAWVGVPVDSRIQTGRTPRHALKQLLDDQRFDRLVLPAAARGSDGFSAEDIAWLLEQAPGEILVLRPSPKAIETRPLSTTAA